MKAKLLLRIRVLLFFLMLFSVARAQNRTVTGTVTARSSGQPLAGATVSIKGTKAATTTAENGSFKIDVPPGARTFIISYIGMATQEIGVPSSGTISIQLEET